MPDRRLPVLILLLASLVACTTAPPRPLPPTDAPPVDAPPPPAAVPVAPELSPADAPDVRLRMNADTRKSAPAAPVAAPTPAPPPAVLALLQEASADLAGGNLDNAAAALERAIRIQPRSGLLWQKLAEVRLRQQQPGLAEDLAKKSNVLGKGDAALVRKNWAIIADARRKQGDVAGAAEAEAKAAR